MPEILEKSQHNSHSETKRELPEPDNYLTSHATPTHPSISTLTRKHPTVIVITCASGRQASAFLPELISTSTTPIRLVVNSTTSQSRLQSQYPSTTVIQADLTHPTDCQKITKDATTIYHILPPFHPSEYEIGKTLIDAAVTESHRPGNTLQHFILSTVIQSQLRKLMNHDVKRYVEEHLMESGLNYTILKPTAFFDNFTPALQNLVKQADTEQKRQLEFTAPWNPNTLFSEIALDDLGSVSLKIISEGSKHYFASYDLTSTLPQPWRHKIDILSKKLGREIVVKAGQIQDVVPGFVKGLIGGDDDEDEVGHKGTTDGVERMILYYNRRGIVGNPGVLEMVLGRKAMTTEEWVERRVEEARKGIGGET